MRLLRIYAKHYSKKNSKYIARIVWNRVKTKKYFYATLFIMERHYWFKAKTHGFWWTPENWKGWTVVTLWVLVVVATVKYAFIGVSSFGEGFMSFLKLIALWSFLFFAIFWKKFELPYFFRRTSGGDTIDKE